jgi:hypothetical protein
VLRVSHRCRCICDLPSPALQVSLSAVVFRAARAPATPSPVSRSHMQEGAGLPFPASSGCTCRLQSTRDATMSPLHTINHFHGVGYPFIGECVAFSQQQRIPTASDRVLQPSMHALDAVRCAWCADSPKQDAASRVHTPVSDTSSANQDWASGEQLVGRRSKLPHPSTSGICFALPKLHCCLSMSLELWRRLLEDRIMYTHPLGSSMYKCRLHTLRKPLRERSR